MIMANTLLNVDCVSSSVQRILHVLSHVLIIQKACEAGMAVSPIMQMRGLKY